jgi:Mrp family chromosome partitioning ATPase
MSKNFEVLCRVEQEQGAIATDSPVDVSVLLEDERTYTPGRKTSSPSHSEILKLVHVLFLSSANAPHHVLFCGVDNGDGSGRVCASAAKALASEVSSSVCLVDANGLGPSMQPWVDLNESASASSKSVEQRNSIARQINRNLWFVSPAHLSSTGDSNGGVEQMCSTLLELRKEFGYLLVDAPPLGTDLIASVLGQVTDGIVLILEANATRRVTARSAKRTLEAANVRLLGTVLNNRTFPIPEKLYCRL